MSEQPTFLVEEQQPKNKTILLWGVIIGVTTAVIIVILSTIFYRSSEQAIYEQQLKPQDAEMEQLKAKQKQHLHSYGMVDKEKHIMHMPIEAAMKKLVEEGQK